MKILPALEQTFCQFQGPFEGGGENLYSPIKALSIPVTFVQCNLQIGKDVNVVSPIIASTVLAQSPHYTQKTLEEEFCRKLLWTF